MLNMQKDNENISVGAFRETLAAEVVKDFKHRQSARRPIENQWQLNLSFLKGKQFDVISSAGDVREEDGGFYWQCRNVYNHILPVIDTRLAKLARVRPAMSVRAATDDDSDIYTARIATRVLNSTWNRLDGDSIVAAATEWSEVTGTVFYNIGWNVSGGKYLGNIDGKDVYEGDAEIEVVSPFEIFPDSLSRNSVEECESIIRARVVSAAQVYEVYGADIKPHKLSALGYEGGASEEEGVLLIERYERPSHQNPNGRIAAVANGKLVYLGEFPYANGSDGERVYPFVRQLSHGLPGNFFGTSVIDRLIPLQRAYNAVRNRKQEFLNRISMGVMIVEDGSCDADALAEEGLQPGKIIVYRQGSEPPKMMEADSLPADFEKEEEKILDEFVLLGGVNEVSQNYKATLGVTSAAGLQLLLEQDDERMTVSAENIRRSVREVSKRVIRLFRQFTAGQRLMRIAGQGGAAEVFYFNAGDLTSDDVIFETENELTYSPSQRRSNILELVASGILNGEDGHIDPGIRVKLLELMGFSGLYGGKSASSMHSARAAEENVKALEGLEVEEYDDHEIHIAEHTRFLVGREYAALENGEAVKAAVAAHLKAHKAVLEATKIQEVPENAQNQPI